jgi:membrane protease YdiL (CAAX protease family)
MKHIKIALFLGLLGLIAGAFVVPFQLDSLRVTLSEAEYENIIADIPVPLPVVMAVAAIQICILTFGLGWIGLILTKRTGLSLPLLQTWLLEKKRPVIDRFGFKLAVAGGAGGSLFLVFIDLFLFQPFIPKIGTDEGINMWKAVLGGVFYGGIVEEVILRLFLMTFIVWLMAFLFKKKRGEIPTSFYWAGLILASLVFSAGHLPATAVLYEVLTPMLIVRAFVLNGFLGILFGYLYWKKGLEYAMFSHMTVHITSQLFLLPLLNLIS